MDSIKDFQELKKPYFSYKDRQNLVPTFFYKNVEITNKNLHSIVGKLKICNSWSTLTNILEYMKNYNIPCMSNDSLNLVVLTEIEIHEQSEERLKRIKFIREQIYLLNKSKIIYSSDTSIWANTIFFTFPGAYCSLKESKMFILPSPRHLKRLILKIGSINSGLDQAQINYLAEKGKILNDMEKHVILMLGEIYVKSDISYKGLLHQGLILKIGSINSGLDQAQINYLAEKGKILNDMEKHVILMLGEIYVNGKIEGFASSGSEVSPTTTIQAFMVSSIFSNYKDIVSLFPVCTLKHSLLHELTLKILKVLSNLGFHVLVIISDNNAVNRKMFEMLCGGKICNYFSNPFSKNYQKVFVLFDTVHIFKSIINNWFNQKDNYQTLFFPDIADDMQVFQNFPHPNELTVEKACLNDLKSMFMKEDQIIKLAPSLSRKVLFPTSIERKNVNFKSNCKILILLSNWWKIVNCKSQFKGTRFRDSYFDPINCVELDKNLLFLENFIKWLQLWDDLLIPGGSWLPPIHFTRWANIAFTHLIFPELSSSMSCFG
nr:unnamed protein product [Callosobruchus analis]